MTVSEPQSSPSKDGFVEAWTKRGVTKIIEWDRKGLLKVNV